MCTDISPDLIGSNPASLPNAPFQQRSRAVSAEMAELKRERRIVASPRTSTRRADERSN
jgi:hypothetical protein